jgi:DNA modification methylase
MSQIECKIGNTLDLLKDLDDESVQLVVTSPPYWGLRDYGDRAKTVWDGDKDCEHEWSQSTKERIVGKAIGLIGLRGETDRPSQIYCEDRKLSGSQICSKCGAWYGQLGLEPTLEMYLSHLLQITTELKRVLRSDGCFYLNIGDTYGGSGCGTGGSPEKLKLSKEVYHLPKGQNVSSNFRGTNYNKCLLGIPWRIALKMIDEQGWILRNDIIWHKPNHMPSSVKDRFTNAYEHIFMLVKNKKYYFNLDAVREKPTGRTDPITSFGRYNRQGAGYRLDALKGKNPGDLWTINTKPYKEAHFAVFPSELVVKPILSSSRPGDLVLDPFAGSGTVGEVCQRYDRNCLMFEINPDYEPLIRKRCHLDSNLERYI